MEKNYRFIEDESHSYGITKHDDITGKDNTIGYLEFKKISIHEDDTYVSCINQNETCPGGNNPEYLDTTLIRCDDGTKPKPTKEFNDFMPKDREKGTLLYNDYASIMGVGSIFYVITDIRIENEERRKGYATQLIELFFEHAKDTPILVQAGLSRYDFSKEQFEEKYKDGTLLPYIYENIVPFFEKNGFTDVNDTILGYENVITMIKNNPTFCK